MSGEATRATPPAGYQSPQARDLAPRASVMQMVGTAVATAALMLSVGSQLWASKAEVTAAVAVIGEVRKANSDQLAEMRRSTDLQINALKEMTDKQIQALRAQSDQALLRVDNTFRQFSDELREERRARRGAAK